MKLGDVFKSEDVFLGSRWGCQSSLRNAFEVSIAIITTSVRAEPSNLTWYPFTMTQL